MLVDLHVHSYASDGTLSPTELVIHAKENGLSAIALTDHDTINGLDEAIDAGKLYQVEVIPGIELAAEFTTDNLHILGYCIKYKNNDFIKKLEPIQNSRDIRNQKMILKLNDLGFSVTMDEIYNISDDSNNSKNIITRAHFAKALYNKGYVSSIQETFELYLSPGKPGYVERIIPTPKECIDLIHSVGGIAVLAHPTLYGLNMGKSLEKLIAELTSCGLDGIEAIYPLHNIDEEIYFKNLANKYNLLITGGSDFHGTNKPGLKIGTGYSNLKIPYPILEKIKSKASLNTK